MEANTIRFHSFHARQIIDQYTSMYYPWLDIDLIRYKQVTQMFFLDIYKQIINSHTIFMTLSVQSTVLLVSKYNGNSIHSTKLMCFFDTGIIY
jgi:hypothetical protein